MLRYMPEWPLSIPEMAQWEREEIASRVAASVPIRARLGKHIAGQARYAYYWEENKLIPDPKEAPVRRLMYELFLEHQRKGTVARLLNEAGYRTRNGCKWSYATVRRLLRDPTAKGVRRANYLKQSNKTGRMIHKPQEEWIYTSVEPIVSEELWTRCNQIMDDQEKAKRPAARKTVHLFSGIVFCNCGHKMYVPSDSLKYTCYTCRNKIGVDDLEDIFHKQLHAFFLSPVEITKHLKQADDAIKKKK